MASDPKYRATAWERAVAIYSRNGKFCPNCGRRRRRDVETFCGDCTALLPRQMQLDLTIRDRFPRVYHDSLKLLDDLRSE